MRKKFITISLFILALLWAPITFATDVININVIPKKTVGDLIGIIQNIGDAILAVGGALAVLMLILGGVRYVLSAGNANQIEGAKKTIQYALIGIVIIAFSGFALRLIQSVL